MASCALGLRRDESGEALGRNENVAGGKQIGNLVPIYFADIEAKSDPTFRANVGRKIESILLSGDKRGIFRRHDFARDRDNAVAVMVVEKIGEGFLAD